MGGAMAGEFASRITVDKITRLLPRSFKQSADGHEGSGSMPTSSTSFTTRSIARCSFVGAGYEECARDAGDAEPLLVHARLDVLRPHRRQPNLLSPGRGAEIRQLSHGRHVRGLAVSHRHRSANARRGHHPRRTALQKALGGGNQFVDPQVGAVAYEPGDKFLLCTDGLTEGLYDAQIFELLRHPDAIAAGSPAARRLVGASLERAGRDNTTAVVVEMG